MAERRPVLDARALRARLRVILFARVAVVTLFLGGVAVSSLRDIDSMLVPLLGVTGLIVVAYALSLVSAALLPRVRRIEGFAYGQIFIDIGLITAAIPITGGLTSPMAVWYNLAIIGAAATLFRSGAYWAAATASLVYGALINLIYYGAIPGVLAFAGPAPGFGIVYQVAAHIASFFSIAFLASVLVERVARTEFELARAEASLQEVGAMQSALVQTLESGILSTDRDGRIRTASSSATELIGRPREEVLGLTLREIFPVLRMRFSSGLPSTSDPVEFTYRRDAPGAVHRGGEGEQTLRLRGATLADTFGNPIGTLYTLQDITHLKRLEQLVDESAVVLTPASSDDAPSASTGLIGDSPPILEVRRMIERVAPSNATVLITGESGTGKELAARAIHALSPRRDGPLVVVNCGAIPENLIESELFGHVRGAYSGAVTSRRGHFRAADGGTIFLDEIGELPLSLQPKLLRALQERTFTPVGADSQVAVDVRIVTATNRDLEREVRLGRFREDLFYRLNVIRLDLPPLRERPEDLPILVAYLLERLSSALGKEVEGVSAGAMRRLEQFSFPGNVRELENTLEHAIAMADRQVIDERDLPEGFGERRALEGENGAIDEAQSPPTSIEKMRATGVGLDSELEQIERALILEALELSGGVIKRAAELLGINYRSLRHRLRKYEMEAPSKSRPES